MYPKDNKKQQKNNEQINVENEKIKRKYFDYLSGRKVYVEKTLDTIKKAIIRYDEFSNHEDYKKYNSQKGKNYVKWLEDRKYNGKNIALSTIYHYLRHLREFFLWLCDQPGYKKRLISYDVEYLRLDRKKSRIAMASKREEHPTLEQIQKVVHSISDSSEIDLRDRALMAFALISGMRDSAIISLPIGCVDETKLFIYQDPGKGVKTKASKTIETFLIKYDEKFLEYFLQWLSYLKKERYFGNADPVFPRNKLEQLGDSRSYVSNSVEPVFWQSTSTIRTIFKERFKAVGIPYFPPHSFRHAAISLAEKMCTNIEQYKAVSQNFGHEHLGTTFNTYGTITKPRIEEIVSSLGFDANGMQLSQDAAKQIIAILQKQNG